VEGIGLENPLATGVTSYLVRRMKHYKYTRWCAILCQLGEHHYSTFMIPTRSFVNGCSKATDKAGRAPDCSKKGDLKGFNQQIEG